MKDKTNTFQQKLAAAFKAQIYLRSENNLIVSVDRQRKIISLGKKNDYPDYLLKLRKRQPQHGGIIKGKSDYISGLSIKANTPQAQQWIDSNKWYEKSLRFDDDKVTFGGFYLKVIPNILGAPLKYEHLHWGKIRMSDCFTEVRYSEDWNDQRQTVQTYPLWSPGCKEVSIFRYADYSPVTKKIQSAYPVPEYESGIIDIDTEMRVSNYFNSLVKNDFAIGKIISIKGGKPETQEEEDYLVDALTGQHAGDEEAGKPVVIFSDPGANEDYGVDIATSDAGNLDKQYDAVSKRDQKNIYSAHGVPPELFKYIQDSAPMFDKDKLEDQSEQFSKEYVIPNQKPKLKMLSDFYTLQTGQICEFEIEQFDPIGKDLPLDNPMVVKVLGDIDPKIIGNYLIKKYNLDVPLIQPGQPAPGQPAPVQQVNDHLKNLTAQQSMAIDRAVRKFKNGTYTQAQASILLKSYGLTDDEIKQFLAIQPPPAGQLPIRQRVAFVRQMDFFSLYDKYSHQVSKDDEILEIKYLDGKIKFADDSTDSETNTAVLNKIKDDPEATPDDIAKALGITTAIVISSIAWLNANKLLKAGAKALSKKTTIYTEYNYDKRPEVSGSVIIATTRDFCRQLYAKFREGAKALSFEAIDSMTNEFGEDVWSYRGGWYHNTQTDETEPWCRHIWRATTKIKYE